MTTRRMLLALMAAVPALIATVGSAASQSWPTKPIRWIVP